MGSVGGEDLKTPLSTQTTLVSCSSVQSLATAKSVGVTDKPSTLTSITRRTSSRVVRHNRRPVGLKGRCHTYFKKRRPNLSTKGSSRRDPSSQCLPSKQQDNGTNHFERIDKRVEEMLLRQLELIAILQRTHETSTCKKSLNHPYSSLSPNRFQPRLDVLSPSSWEKYLHVTLYPDPGSLCDMFLSRYNLPHILSGSYDPIELMHMHGWAPEGYSNILLVVQQTNNKDSSGIEVPWKHIDQGRERDAALLLTRIAPLIRQQWLFQGKSIRDANETDVPFETDEFTDSILFLNCPGSTKTILYQSSYDSYGAHFAREPWLSGKRSLLCQLQVSASIF